MHIRRLAALAAAVACVLSVTAIPARAQSSPPWPVSSAMPLTPAADTPAPIGWQPFCTRHPEECVTRALPAKVAELTPEEWDDLNRINRYYNRLVAPLTDLSHWNRPEQWDIATYEEGHGFRGDCEDYVLIKRRALLTSGWPRQSLLITIARDANGQGHAVLTVATNHGDYVLDNQTDDVLPWQETNLAFSKRQSATNPNIWVSITHPTTIASTR